MSAATKDPQQGGHDESSGVRGAHGRGDPPVWELPSRAASRLPRVHQAVHLSRKPTLVGLDSEAIIEWAGKQGLAAKSFTERARDEKTRELIAGYIDALNMELNRWEQIKTFAIIDRELSIELSEQRNPLCRNRICFPANFTLS